jgi:hypothetical protein
MTPFTSDLDVLALEGERRGAMVELRGRESGFRMASFAHAAAGSVAKLSPVDIDVTVGALSEFLDREAARGGGSLSTGGKGGMTLRTPDRAVSASQRGAS